MANNNVNYKYSFSNPMPAYKKYTSDITYNLGMFIDTHITSIYFKSADFWIASKTGFNQNNVDVYEQALYISDALGRVYSFPYQIQNDLFLFLDNKNSLGLFDAINNGSKVAPFNWKKITVSNAIIGYLLNSINMESTPTRNWNNKTLETYISLCNAISNGLIKGVFVPYYLSPNFLKDKIYESLRASNSPFRVGATLLYDYSKGYRESDIPFAIIPDIDFITCISQIEFKSLKLTQMADYYQSLIDSSADFASNNPRIDSPKPKDLVLSKLKNDTYYSSNDITIPKESNKNEIYNDIEERLKKNRKVLNKLYDSLLKIKDKCLNDTTNPNLIVDNVDVIETISSGVGFYYIFKLSLFTINPNINEYCPTNIKDILQNKDRVSLYKTKEKQKLYFNIIFNLVDDKIKFVSTCGLYGSSQMGMELNSGYLNDINLNINSVEDFLNSFIPKSIYSQLLENSLSFDELVFKGLYDGFNQVKKDITLDNLGTYDLNLLTVNETESNYTITFDDNCVLKELIISDNSNSDLEYNLVLDSGRFGYEPDELTCTCVSDELISEVVKDLIVEAFKSFH